MCGMLAGNVLERLRLLPCGRRLLDAVGDIEGVHLVGGAVRDLALGRTPRELDVVVEGEVEPVIERLGGDVREHDRFGTAVVVADGCRYDLVRARAEAYAAPGALPDVWAGSLHDDLHRRDVTVNAIAVALRDGRVTAVPGAEQDLRDGWLRVLHDASFVDDPTRLWRVARYAARLGFAIDPHTVALARAADPSTVSGVRMGNELRLALREPDPLAALEIARGLNARLLPPRFVTRPAVWRRRWRSCRRTAVPISSCSPAA
jgi:tRNA nucleotidyltransferase (CCA-adding enzyme)